MSALAVKTVSYRTMQECRSRARSLYKQWQLAVPSIIGAYHLNVPAPVLRAKIRSEFERHRDVTDPKLASVLIHKGTVELEETMNMWKQQAQLLYMLQREEREPEPQDFLSRFYEKRH